MRRRPKESHNDHGFKIVFDAATLVGAVIEFMNDDRGNGEALGFAAEYSLNKAIGFPADESDDRIRIEKVANH